MDDDDFQPPEPIKGLPEMPPEGEKILWQGKPDWWRLALDALLVKWVAIYFALIAFWQGLAGWLNNDLGIAVASAVWLIGMGVVACAILAAIAWVQAWATVYTVTNRRIVMRIGAALTMALNLPYRWIGSASLQMRGGGTGTIALDLLGSTNFSYLMCWPHVRPWRMRKTQPALRCIPDAEHVARLIAQNAKAQVTVGVQATPDASAIAAE
ncbi:MAG: photosynthetic complex putative assembly protein PuhB [Pseudomonadota bacterium]